MEAVVFERFKTIGGKVAFEHTGEREIEIPIKEEFKVRYDHKRNIVELVYKHSLNGENIIDMTLQEFRDFIVQLTRFYANIKKTYFADLELI